VVSNFDERFQVTWQDPRDAESIWAIDRNHFSHPVPALAEELYRRIIAASWETRSIFVNGYAYLKDFAPPPTPPEVIQRGAPAVWQEDYLPRVRRLCAALRVRDYEAMTAAELVAMLPRLFDESAEAFRYPTVVAGAFMGPGLALADFCERELGAEGPVLAATLLQGVANESMAAGESLGDLASFAAAKPEVAKALCDGRYDDIPSLPGGEEFMARLVAMLESYGWRADDWSLLHLPTWIEQPKTPLFLIGRYLEDPSRSPAEAVRRARELRESTARDIEGRLQADKRPQFQQLLTTAQSHVQFSEERALWQLVAVGSARVPVLALGNKLREAGVLGDPDDVFFLRLDELADLAANPRPVAELIQKRREELDRWETLDPPASIGKPLVVTERSPQSQIVHRYFFGTAVAQPEGDVIQGIAASQGVVSGRARVLHSLAASSALQAGEILVCRNTAPPWTPLFAIAGAVVTDIGGLLSHSAICAREYAIPCVVGTHVATTRISDGDMITVDGTAGTVVIEAAASA
jgi:phosphohistidine swiveling domain-containing protein